MNNHLKCLKAHFHEPSIFVILYKNYKISICKNCTFYVCAKLNSENWSENIYNIQIDNSIYFYPPYPHILKTFSDLIILQHNYKKYQYLNWKSKLRNSNTHTFISLLKPNNHFPLKCKSN